MQFVFISQQQERLTSCKTVLLYFCPKGLAIPGCVFLIFSLSPMHVFHGPLIAVCCLFAPWVGWGHPALILGAGGWLVFLNTSDETCG